MSSTKKTWEKYSLSVTLKPLILCFSLASLINLLKEYDIIRKRNGERGQLCLKLLEAMKKLEGEPLIRTTKEEYLT